MEESKDLQSIYKIFRTFIYLSLVIEFFEYAITPGMLTFWGGIVADIYGRMKLMDIYQDGHLLHSKIMTLLIICVTCIGTRNKKHLEFNAKRMVIYPLSFGLMLMFLSVWMFYRGWQPFFFSLPCSTWLYFLMSVMGTVLCHVALDNISKYLKDGLLKDRFNLENESFLQNDKKIENKYSVNIPMRYYYKGKFRKGWVNIVNPFRGTWVVGTPGSGKTFSIIEPFIRQHSAKGFAVVAYDYKPSSSRLSASTVRRALPSSPTTISSRHWHRSSIIITASTRRRDAHRKAATSTSSTSSMWNTAGG